MADSADSFDMASRISAVKRLLPDFESALHSFTSSPARFRIVQTVNATATQPKTLYILDSSFNPPSVAHLALVTCALKQHARTPSEASPCRLLLLFSTHNADKAPSPASFAQRIALMTMFAEDVSRSLKDEEPSLGAGIARVSIDVGITKEPYYSDKSAAIADAQPAIYTDSPSHVHLVGYDTLIRFCNAKYYPNHKPPLSALKPFFDANHRLRVALRPSDAQDAASSGFGTLEEQGEYWRMLREGGCKDEGFEPAWARNIDMTRATGAVGVSSTRVRQAAKEGRWDEHEGRADSPGLPHARAIHAMPAHRPLLPTADKSSPASRFTSTRSEDLHELRDIFDCARDRRDDQAMPSPMPLSRFSRPSMHSLRSLHKMSSMRSIIRRRFSKDAPTCALAGPSGVLPKDAKTINEESSTMVKQPKDGPHEQLKITKNDLRKHLLSDKKPDQGGYDSDADMLDDIANRIGRKTPGKRPSIHSIEWTPSTASKPTPASSTKGRSSAEFSRNLQPYNVQKLDPASFSKRFSQVFSTPNLRADAPGERDRKLRRSHSATSMGLPKPSPISPLRLPSLSTCDVDGIPWSEAMHKSLRLSQFPVLPRHASPRPGETNSDTANNLKESGKVLAAQSGSTAVVEDVDPTLSAYHSTHMLEIRVQQPTLTESPRSSTSVRGIVRENTIPRTAQTSGHGSGEEDEENPRRSVHLYSMRISHHLRSGSLLSWDQLADAPELPTPPFLIRERTVLDQSRHSCMPRQVHRHDRQSSSSGFASNKVPSRWGNVLPNDQDVRLDAASSLYSSRPQSPPESLGGSMINLPQSTGHRTFSISSSNIRNARRSRSFPYTDKAMPTSVAQRGVDDSTSDRSPEVEGLKLTALMPLARKNSVADTKKSKFREEFSPSPPKKRLTSSSTIAKFLSPKRLSLYSQSEANLQSDLPAISTDGPLDTLLVPVDRERRQSRSLISLQAEQNALGNHKGADPVWDRALQAHQEEKASMFLHRDKDLAVQNNPFRERSGSNAVRRTSAVDDLDPSFSIPDGAKQFSRPLLAPSSQREEIPVLPPASMFRRQAVEARRVADSERVVSTACEKQQDDTAEIIGAWGRYPSHTRHDRTFSVSKLDRVETRDFALEAAIRFASAKDETHDDDLIDPAQRLPSPTLLPGEKKRRKKVGSSRMAKSNSMTFGRALMKNYTKMFRSQSTEFRRHGRGHRSSIASGGILEFPELELVPDVWTGVGHPKEACDQGRRGNLRAEDSMATLRPRRNSSAPNLNELSFRDGANDSTHAQDQARVWSVYYDDCIPSFPRASAEADHGLRNLGAPYRRSTDGWRVPMILNSFPVRGTRHSRNPSQWSRKSTGSLQSAQRSLGSPDDDGGARDDRSMASVRKSTMDLISKFKEQETSEHERVLSFTSTESRRDTQNIRTL
ncbi:hypothetical protein T440DRAFT_557041 [Plenodomus tracheiphilus IPT5]|uniref:Nicotinamide-nucleotide adenylyltransferase n=1 Tax=Plenodomus tracheiphilus IPT5 TaxID=1408161 RepID=A0A6A7B0U0_9PLEO|nr:hypothetical protein T440DRAFT_557041 [Plenodomus tracheiphilus IPT5]